MRSARWFGVCLWAQVAACLCDFDANAILYVRFVAQWFTLRVTIGAIHVRKTA